MPGIISSTNLSEKGKKTNHFLKLQLRQFLLGSHDQTGCCSCFGNGGDSLWASRIEAFVMRSCYIVLPSFPSDQYLKVESSPFSPVVLSVPLKYVDETSLKPRDLEGRCGSTEVPQNTWQAGVQSWIFGAEIALMSL